MTPKQPVVLAVGVVLGFLDMGSDIPTVVETELPLF